MKFFKENDKMPFILVAFGIILYLVLSNLPVVFSGISYVSSVAFPFILGSCVAFIINVPMSFFERKLFYKLKKGKRSLSLIMAIVSIVGVILLVSRLIIPELVDTIFKLSNNIPEYVKEIQALLEKTSMNKPMVHKYVNQITFDWDKISGELITFLQDGSNKYAKFNGKCIDYGCCAIIVKFCIGICVCTQCIASERKIINAGEKGIGRFFTGTGCEVYCTSWKTIK